MNTPDTEWEKEFEAEFMEYAAENENTLIDSDTDGKRVKQFIRSLITSRDTHWKERDKKLRLHLGVILPMAKGYVHTNDVGRNREMVSNAEDFLAELDNIE